MRLPRGLHLFLLCSICGICGICGCIGESGVLEVPQGVWEVDANLVSDTCNQAQFESVQGRVNVSWIQDHDGNRLVFRDFRWQDSAVFVPFGDILVIWSIRNSSFSGSAENIVGAFVDGCSCSYEVEFAGELIDKYTITASSVVRIDNGDTQCVLESEWLMEHYGV